MAVAQLDHASARVTKNVYDSVSAEEWQMRVDLAACYRIIAKFGMTDHIHNHISAVVPGEPNHFLINAFGLDYTEVTASNLYKIDNDGNVVMKPDTEFGINTAGFVIHSAVHMARPDLICVLHTHTLAGTAVAGLKCGLLPVHQTGMRFYGRVGYHEFELPFTDIGERERLVAALGDNDVMILRNHGLLAGGRSIPEAFNAMMWLENACKIQIAAMSTGAELSLPSHEIASQIADRYSFQKHPERVMGLLEWQALVRQLDRDDPSYKELTGARA